MTKQPITQPDLNIMLFYAFRYCLGRSTYAVNECVSLIRKYQDCLHENTIDLIVRDITRAAESNDIGMDCDRKEWLALAKELEMRK